MSLNNNSHQDKNMVRVRFAPSPTGFLHVGGLRTALYNYLFAKKHKGKLIFRLEDTDQNRLVEGASENLISTLQWAGIEFDEGPVTGGEYGPYIQSERTELYQLHAQQLLKSGHAYKCFCTPQELEEMRIAQQKASLPPKYDKRCLRLSEAEIKEKESIGISHVIRMKVEDGVITFNDLIRGEVKFDSENVDDQVLIKSDGFPTYHLAHLVDDHFMKITHVIRGEEWLSSTPKHILLYKYFGWIAPQFAHLPLLLNPDRSKLSKRQGDVAVEDYKQHGYQKEALINFIALLGWNPGDEREIFHLDELEKEFSLERVIKSGAIFNIEKLNWINGQHIRRTSLEDLVKQVQPIAHEHGIHVDDEYMEKVIRSMKERVHFIHEFITVSKYFFHDPKSYDEQAIAKRWNEFTSGYLLELLARLITLDAFVHDEIESALKEVALQLGIKNSELIHPLRLAVSGFSVGPGLYEMMEIIGKDVCIRRIKHAIEVIK